MANNDNKHGAQPPLFKQRKLLSGLNSLLSLEFGQQTDSLLIILHDENFSFMSLNILKRGRNGAHALVFERHLGEVGI